MANGIKSISQARNYLKESTRNKDILKEIRHHIEQFHFDHNIDAIQDDLHKLVNEIYESKFENVENELGSDLIKNAIFCVIFYEIYDNIFHLIRRDYQQSDLELFKKCEELCDLNVSCEQLGCDQNYPLDFVNAVTELSMLNKYKSTFEKFDCLHATHDLIYAKIKGAEIDLKAKYSEEEIIVPIIEKRNLVPLFELVLVKSKLMYLASDLYFMQHFGHDLYSKDATLESIFDAFAQAVDNLFSLNPKELANYSKKIKKSLSVVEIIKMTAEMEKQSMDTCKKGNCEPSLYEEENLKVAESIVRSTWINYS